MQESAADLDVADAAPTAPILTGYDEQHLLTYLRLLDAAADGADWNTSRGPCCRAAIRMEDVLPHPSMFPDVDAIASLECSRSSHQNAPRKSSSSIHWDVDR
jgi:hypothetical protein